MKRRLFPASMLFLFGLLSAHPDALAQTTFRITGVVVNSITKNPVGHCHLQASLTENQRRPVLARASMSRRFGVPSAAGSVNGDTDEQGHFSLTVPSSGTWRLTASAQGYVTQAYDAHGAYSSAVVLTESTPSFNLQFLLPPEGRISGTVIDEAGEPVRNGMVRLIAVPLAAPSVGTVERRTPQARAIMQTDDLGRYEFDGLPVGEYRINVEAHPWYATGAWQRRGNTAQTANSPLDVTYASTWYPGVDDPDQAQAIALQPGDDRKADFQLNPIPSIHLQIMMPAPPPVEPGGRQLPYFPMIERIDSVGPRGGQSQYSSRGPDGSVDIGGLAPGTYRITLQGPDHAAQAAVVELTGASAQVVDLRQPLSSTANIAVQVDNESEGSPQTFVQLHDPSSGQSYGPQFEGMRFNGTNTSGSLPVGRSSNREAKFIVPSGRYELLAYPRNTAYVTSISAVGAKVDGRMLDVLPGEAVVTIHTAEGRATIGGVVKRNEKVCSGAMVMLVPAGLDDGHSFTAVARDQSNTDGSFDLRDVVPGDYILIAVDNGWHINWADPQTLNQYLVHGTPLTVLRSQKLQQNIEAQSP